MAELPKLNGDEQLFLQTIFTVFHKEGKWPTYNYVERTITRTHPDYDMDAIIKGLPEGFATVFKYSHRYDEEAKLIVPALYYCQEAEEELADFIRVVRHCVDRYYTFDAETPEKDTLEISSNDLSNQLHMQPLTIRKMGLLLQSEYDIAFGFSSDLEGNEWHFPLKRGKLGVSRFRGVETFEQYLEQRTPLAPVQPARNYTGQTVLQLAKNRPANDAPVVGMGDTQYHIVQGDQYNISGNVKVTSLSTDAVSPRRLRVFLCHSSGDKLAVRSLYQRLEACNIDPWLDEENLLPGQNWEYEIRKAVRITDIVIVCLSPGSISKTGYVQKEIKFALDVADEQPEDTIFLIPLKLEECDIPTRLKHLHCVNYFQEDGFNKFMKALVSRSESIKNEKLAPVNFPKENIVEPPPIQGNEEQVQANRDEKRFNSKAEKENISTKEDALRYLSDPWRVITIEDARKVCEIVGVVFPNKLIMHWKDAIDAMNKYSLKAVDNDPGTGVLTYNLSNYIIDELGLSVDQYSGRAKQVRANREALAKKIGIS